MEPLITKANQLRLQHAMKYSQSVATASYGTMLTLLPTQQFSILHIAKIIGSAPPRSGVISFPNITVGLGGCPARKLSRRRSTAWRPSPPKVRFISPSRVLSRRFGHAAQ